MDQSFAILQMGGSDLDNREIARVIAEPMNVSLPDLAIALSQRSGILAENLREDVAMRCTARLFEAGLEAKVIPQSAVLELPELLTLRSGRPDDEVFFYLGTGKQGVVKWSEVMWVDFVAIPERSTKEVEDSEIQWGRDGASMRQVVNRRTVIKQTLFVDLVTYEPWLLMRIPQERFEFSATGLPMSPVRRDNLVALAATIASRSTRARFGPGLQLNEAKTRVMEHRVPSQAIYRGFLRWKLTQLFLE